MVETDYETYALLSTESVRGPGQDFHMATLYSTCPMPRPPPGLGHHPWGRLGAPRPQEQGQSGDAADQWRLKASPPCPRPHPDPQS